LIRKNDPALTKVFELQLARALEHVKRSPWESEPRKDSKQVGIETESKGILSGIKWFMRNCGKNGIAFDFETTGLKPHRKRHRIVCASMSNGRRTFAFPISTQDKQTNPKVVQQFKEFLQSPCPKIAANLKFEESWSRAVLETRVNNWVWDTMVMQHLLDNRPNTTGLKFQVFVRYGVSDYNSKVEPYLRAKTGNDFNQIDKIPLSTLLTYCGLDSLYEYRLACDQRQEMSKLEGIQNQVS
jgi:DNA polymerase I-like protein with 3'-5' exonuclease and polymerase domains